MHRKTTLGNSTESGQSVTRNGSPSKAVFGNAADVVHDVTELVELQAKLLAADINSVKSKLTLPIILLVLAMGTVIALLPVALLGAAELIIDQTDLSRAIAYLCAAGAAATIAVILVVAAWQFLRKSFRELDNSRRELQHNIDWIKKTLKTGGQHRSDRPTI